ncbi:MAG: type II toxin-antitoxin system RelE/ParE family toxin [Azonexus sp.]|jgi:putative addiction module killer protein|nr:type II toxin-antitoxin system RelE/ParE family toxin [Azonexus sp.]
MMNTIETTDVFDDWLNALTDLRGRTKIQVRIDMAEAGNFGDCAAVGEGVSEMRIHYGPGYRVYFKRTGMTIYLLLAGGDKSTQKQDIKAAQHMARELGV